MPQLSTSCSIGYMTAPITFNGDLHTPSKQKQESNQAILPSFANKLKDTKYSSCLAPLSKTGLGKCNQGWNALFGKGKRNKLSFRNLEIEYFAELETRNYF